MLENFKLSKSRVALLTAGSFLLIAGPLAYITRGSYLPSLNVNAYTKVENRESSVEKENLVPAPLSGLMIPASKAKKRPIGSMVENSSSGARPQSGLEKADIVFETLAEGGITRFYAIFQSKEADEIGPVRSARPYYVSWAAGLKAGYAHIGQSPEALNLLRTLGDNIVPDINFGFRFNSGYKRVTFKSAPHNVYTSTEQMRALLANIGQDKDDSYEGYLFKDDLAESLRPESAPAPNINFYGRIDQYSARYEYDKESNDYRRFVGGASHTDRITNAQLTAKNIIVMYLPSYGRYASGHGRIDVKNTGSGKALLFRDGKVINLKWSKANNEAPLSFTTDDGFEPLLNRGGTTWIEGVYPISSVNY